MRRSGVGALLLLALALPARADAACDFTGTAGRDNVVIQLSGNDNLVEICTLGGNDRVEIAAPTVPTESIKVVVRSGGGADRVVAPASFMGRLEVRAAAGNDVVQGGSGPDLLDGGRGGDILKGGASHDRAIAGRGADTTLGQSGNDAITSGPGKDVSKGGGGADKIDGRQEPLPHIIEACVDHVGPGETYIVLKIGGAPYTDFEIEMLDPLAIKGKVGEGQTGPTGRTERRIRVPFYGGYGLTLLSTPPPLLDLVLDSIPTDGAFVNVTPAEGCTADPN